MKETFWTAYGGWLRYVHVFGEHAICIVQLSTKS